MKISLCLVVMCLSTFPALADDERPWAKGIPAATQEQALRIFREANSLFEESKYSQALALYRDALKVWDHPAIRYNAAVALINLDQPLAAFENLESALRFQEAPFGAETHKQAQLYKKLLSGQLAELEVVCDEAGAEITLDGEVLFIGPGQGHRRLIPGPHQLVARKSGYKTETAALQLLPGKLQHEEVKMQLLSAAPVNLVRRWPVWMPWTVAGAGALVALVGIPFMAAAQSSLNTFDADLARVCPLGCTQDALPQTVLAARNAGRVENGVAVGLFTAGTAAVATGIVLVAMNGLQPEKSTSVLALTPVVSPRMYGVIGTWNF